MEVLKPFFSWLVISWEMTISGSGQPLLRVTKANNIRVLFSWSSPETSVPLDLLLCCVCAGFGGGFLLIRQCRNPLSLCFVLSEAAADALALNQAGIHCQFGIQSHAGAWMLWDKSFLINSIRNAINSFVQWKKSCVHYLNYNIFFRGEVFWWFLTRRCLQSSLAALPGAQELPEPLGTALGSPTIKPLLLLP